MTASPTIRSRPKRTERQAVRGAIFFDRDGVLNVDSGFVHRVKDFRWIKGARKAVKLVNDAGLYVIVVTNQSGVARGYYGEEDVQRLHSWMVRDLARHGAHIDAFYYCPYLDDANVATYRVVDHPDRKPNPGMIMRALSDFGVDPGRAVLIGDKASDLEAAGRAGVGARLFTGGSLATMVVEMLAGMGC
jgi:D-glycero-D-manno-heptose 1,7-bisphosphate phosphatase